MSTRAYAIEVVLGNAVAQITLTGIGPNEVLLVNSATVLNGDTTSRLLTMNLASGGAANSTSNLIEYKLPLPVNRATNTALSGKTIMPGAKLYAGCDAASVCVLQISGTVISQAT